MNGSVYLTLKKKYEMDMTTGSVFSKMICYAIPVMLSGVLQLLFNAADIVIVGRFAGDDSLAAVGSTASLIGLLTNLFIGLSIGTNVLVARFSGSGDEIRIKKTVHTSMLLSFFSGIILTAIGIAVSRSVLELMRTPSDVLGLAVLYLRIYFLGMTSMMIYNFGAAILRAKGDTKRPLYYLTISGVINVALNLILVIIFHLGVAGVAIATAVSQTISAVLVVICLIREKGAIHLNVKSLKVDKDIFFNILRIGLPAGFQGVLFSISNMVIQTSVNAFGTIVVAGNSAAANIESFIYVANNSFYQTTLSFASQNLGAKKYKRINKIILAGVIYAAVTGFILGNLVVIFGENLLGIYTSDPEVIKNGMVRLTIIGTAYIFAGIMDVMVGAVRGIGYSLAPMLISIFGVCGLRLLWIATVFQIPVLHIPQTIYYSYPITWVVTTLILLITFLILKKRMVKEEVC